MLLPLLLLLVTSFTLTHASKARTGFDAVDGSLCRKYVRGQTRFLGSRNVEAVCLTPKQNLDVGSCITVGNYFLGLTPDGYLTQGLTQPGSPITWKSRNPNARLEFTGTSLKVGYSDSVLWRSWSNRKKANAFCLKSDGGVQVLRGSETLWSKPKPKCNEKIGTAVQVNGGNARCVKQGQVLFACQAVQSDEFTLRFTGYGISLLRGKDEEWSLPTTVKSTSAYLVFQMDGYIAVFDKTGTQVWKSFTAASQGSSLCLESNGGVVYYDGVSSVDVFPVMPSASSTMLSLSSSVYSSSSTDSSSIYSSTTTTAAATSTVTTTTTDTTTTVSTTTATTTTSAATTIDSSTSSTTTTKVKKSKTRSKSKKSKSHSHTKSASHSSTTETEMPSATTTYSTIETSETDSIPSTTTTASETTTASQTETSPSSTSTHSTTTTTTLSNSQQKALNAHNNFRSGYGMPPLQYDTTIESSAKRHAESLASTECKAIVQTTGTAGHGQNVAYWTSSTPANFDITYFARMWQNTNTSVSAVSSATQMLWKSTERVGCYVANGSVEEEFCQIAVCEYSPPGNVQGYNWKEGS
ncbi:hypothetical protein HDU77_009774 [Chytriomyces hyalinus]|nr:hypothetical protein HDU77_009774 [Chytriomyces hyalinus]